jgi:cell division protein FtsI/penicillin-binding protein 2
MTPVETIRALNSIVNGGYLVTPHLVKAINYDTGITKTLSWGPPVQVLQTQSANTVRQMLVTVVDSASVDYPIRIANYSIGAKTGTAQIVDPVTKAYYPNKYLHTYFGFLPGSNPQFSIFLFAYDPNGGPYSADTWSSYFHQLTEFLINYYNVPPDR